MMLNAALILACSGLVHESARWLLSRGRLDEAQRVVASSARFNGLPEGEVQRLVLGMAADAPKDGASVTARQLCDLFCSRTLRFYTIFLWFQVYDADLRTWASTPGSLAPATMHTSGESLL
ncbi:solute carrier family 22 member 7-like [Amblyomma americanum]